jgi:hypothetical protein
MPIQDHFTLWGQLKFFMFNIKILITFINPLMNIYPFKNRKLMFWFTWFIKRRCAFIWQVELGKRILCNWVLWCIDGTRLTSRELRLLQWCFHTINKSIYNFFKLRESYIGINLYIIKLLLELVIFLCMLLVDSFVHLPSILESHLRWHSENPNMLCSDTTWSKLNSQIHN